MLAFLQMQTLLRIVQQNGYQRLRGRALFTYSCHGRGLDYPSPRKCTNGGAVRSSIEVDPSRTTAKAPAVAADTS